MEGIVGPSGWVGVSWRVVKHGGENLVSLCWSSLALLVSHWRMLNSSILLCRSRRAWACS
eukprot:5079281-Pyramimonas_sp.AAC.1